VSLEIKLHNQTYPKVTITPRQIIVYSKTSGYMAKIGSSEDEGGNIELTGSSYTNFYVMKQSGGGYYSKYTNNGTDIAMFGTSTDGKMLLSGRFPTYDGGYKTGRMRVDVNNYLRLYDK
jgi:hypothetical protein